eukprot:10248392-Lingulodinium_polyedra.AAC.1
MDDGHRWKERREMEGPKTESSTDDELLVSEELQRCRRVRCYLPAEGSRFGMPEAMVNAQ